MRKLEIAPLMSVDGVVSDPPVVGRALSGVEAARFSAIDASNRAANMWSTEHTITTVASPEAIWRLWANVPGWPRWIADSDPFQISGPFAPGSTILMAPPGQESIELRIADAVEPELFCRRGRPRRHRCTTIHRVERIDDRRSCVTYRMEITGPAADTVGPELGAQISADFPETPAALVKLAES